MIGDNWYPEGTLAEPFLPQEIDAATAAFPATVSHLLPPVESIPEEFKGYPDTEWNKIMNAWMFSGLSEKVKFYPKENIDPEKAFKHLAAIMGSFQPKHEYKESAVAYLMSIWFEKITNWKK